MLEKGKDRNGYEEPRHMLSICYMGVLARAQGDVGIVVFNAVAKLIRDFEEQYRQAYFSSATIRDVQRRAARRSLAEHRSTARERR
jgi:hypothetical protein